MNTTHDRRFHQRPRASSVLRISRNRSWSVSAAKLGAKNMKALERAYKEVVIKG
ncbi:MAG: hypothetical protein MZU79_09105 [Anaerotruncus sp.]|nr:hypothetical protein [Anaerotruncus sp.]